MNTRDTKLTRLTDVNLHRVIRRGTTYGPSYDKNALSEADDQVPRGPTSCSLGAKAMAAIEFLQQEWINDGNFMGLGDEPDPIIGLLDEPRTCEMARAFPELFARSSSADEFQTTLLQYSRQGRDSCPVHGIHLVSINPENW